MRTRVCITISSSMHLHPALNTLYTPPRSPAMLQTGPEEAVAAGTSEAEGPAADRCVVRVSPVWIWISFGMTLDLDLDLIYCVYT